jgi:putative membrane protein
MKTSLLPRLLFWLALTLPAPLLAAEPPPAPPTWHAQSLGQAIGYMILFAAVGVALAIAGYKLFDKCTPGDLHKEILEHKNIAAAIVAAAVILGVCLIVAAAMVS